MATWPRSLRFAAVGMSCIAGAAHAATSTGQLSVTATVQSGCALNGGTMNFGQYQTGQTTNLDVQGEVRYSNCTGSISIELDGGQTGNVNGRQMSQGSSRLNYQLYRSSLRNTVFGTGTNAQSFQLFVPLSGKVDIYGRIPGGQAIPAGTYTDTINITMTF